MNEEDRLFSHDILETDILYIIGNGFDCAHDIKSKYSDFKQWCEDSKRDTMLFDILFSTKQEFWESIEKALGNYDEKEILEFCKPDVDFDFDHSLSSSARIEDAPMTILQPAINDLKNYFNEWVNTIDITKAKPFLKIYKNARFLTFNYTETLEEVYDVPREQICHLHGNRLLKDNHYIFGHNKYQRYNGAYSELPIYEENAYISIIEYMNALRKPIEEIIKANQMFLDILTDIKLVYILGHSLSDIDKEYFTYILSHFKHQPRFVISNKENIENINRFITENKIEAYKIISIDKLRK